MRIALIGDIQGNGVALEAVLENISLQRPDTIVCLGDVASGPEPRTVLKLLREHGCGMVIGNMDAALLEPQPARGNDPDAQRYAEIDRWCAGELGPDDHLFMSGFRDQITLALEAGVTLLCCHAAPGDFNAAITAGTPDTELSQLLPEIDAQAVAIVHMHNPMLRCYRGMMLVNPGSVGLPAGAKQLPMSCTAQYALISSSGGQLEVTFHQVSYDPGTLRRRILNSGMPHANWYAAMWEA